MNLHTGAKLAEADDGLSALFAPRAVAIVGASADEAKFGGRVMRNLLRFGFEGAIYPINAKAAAVFGIPCHARLADVPGPVDLAVIAVPKAAVMAVLEDCAAVGVKAAAIVSSGFAETGEEGAEAQRALVARARELGIRLLGPNCLGHYHAANKLAASANQAFDRALEPGTVALISQSGALGGSLLDAGADMGLRFSIFASTGNSADWEVSDLLLYVARDDSTRVILAYIEGVRDFARFEQGLAAARAQGKPVIVLRAGWSERGAGAIHSHTGSLAGSSAAYLAVLRRHRAVLVRDVAEAIDSALLAASGQWGAGARLGVVTVSGGMGSLAADRCDDLGLELSRFGDATRQALRQALPAFAPDGNPLDLTGAVTSSPGWMGAALRAIGEDAETDAIAILLTVVYGIERLAEEIVAVRDALARPVFVVISGGACVAEARRMLREHQIPVFNDLQAGLGAYARCRALADVGYAGSAVASQELDEADARAIAALIALHRKVGAAPILLNEVESKKVVRRLGIPTCPERQVTTADEAVEAAAQIGYPVVLKGITSQIGHKAKAGLVRLDLCAEAQLREAFEGIASAAQTQGVALQGLLLQPMARRGLEFLIGGVRDGQAGPLVAFGLGGTQTERLRQVTFRPAPLTAAEAQDMIGEIPLCREMAMHQDGVFAFFECALVQVSLLLARFPEIVELDINPLICEAETGDVVAVDALLTIGGGDHDR